MITLEGWSPTDEARRAASDVAKGVPGVAEVINDLQLGEEDEDQTGVSSALP